MYLHLGMDVVIPQSEVVGILDLETTSISKITRQFLDTAQKRGQVINVGDELPKSYVIATNKRGCFLYVSPISVQTLAKRAGKPFQIADGKLMLDNN